MKIKGEDNYLNKTCENIHPSKEFFSRHPHIVIFAVTYLAGLIISILFALDDYFNYGGPGEPSMPDAFTLCALGGLFSVFLVLPVILFVINMIALFHIPESARWRRVFLTWEWLSILMSVLVFLEATVMSGIDFGADWQETLYNIELHSPIWTEAYLTVFVLGSVAVLGYFILSCIPICKLPPLVTVLCIAAMYIGVILCVVWNVQLGNQLDIDSQVWLFCFFLSTFNLIVIALKTIRYKMAEWNEGEKPQEESRGWIAWVNRRLNHAANWPVAALIFMLPLLGILIAILVLFGQRPDAIVKAWTETSDWKLSARISPPNIQIDEHYLCTVAAGGHRKVVKPLRMGERHGHRVVVNRQLCIANAFEQILEERTPNLHRHVRHFYDTYGFPVAKMIRSKWAADFVYLLMKPLEWVFLIVIYLCDVKPENRIAVQYLPKK